MPPKTHMDDWQIPFEMVAEPDGGAHPVLQRALLSTAEFAALMAGAGSEVAAAKWMDVRFVSFELSGTGAVRVSLPGFFSVARSLGSSVATQPRATPDMSPGRNASGTVLVHGLRQSFDYRWHRPHRVDWVCLEPRLLRAACREFGIAEEAPPIPLRAAAEDFVCANLLGVLAEEAAIGPHLAQRLIVESVAIAIAARLLQRFRAGVRAICPPGALSMQPFRDVCAHIDDNLGSRLSLGELAAVAGVSRFHFARQFRLRTGETPMGYVLRLRVERAQQLLRARGCRIADVAALLGFADQSHFTRTFKRFVGVAPSRYFGNAGAPAGSASGASIATAPDPRSSLHRRDATIEPRLFDRKTPEVIRVSTR